MNTAMLEGRRRDVAGTRSVGRTQLGRNAKFTGKYSRWEVEGPTLVACSERVVVMLTEHSTPESGDILKTLEEKAYADDAALYSASSTYLQRAIHTLARY